MTHLSRPLAGILALLAVASAAWATFGNPGTAFACVYVAAPTPALALPGAGIAVVASVDSASETEVSLTPQVFLKGPANADPIVFRREANVLSDCDASFTAGDRVLLFIPANGINWPTSDMVFPLVDGFVTWSSSRIDTESKVISDLRSVTGQYAVPAENKDEGATLDWKKVVLPVGLATLAVFGVSLILMRIWHRIDPS